MLIAMLLFYNGEYGNIFQVIGAGGMAALKGLLKVILAIWGSGGGDSTVAEEQTTQAETDADLSDVEEIYEPSAAASAVLEALAVILIIAAAAGICYLIYRYVKNFNKKRKPQGYIEEITTLEKETVRVRKQKTETDTIKTAPETESLRKAYKRQVLKNGKRNTGRTVHRLRVRLHQSILQRTMDTVRRLRSYMKRHGMRKSRFPKRKQSILKKC